jgi:8-oxo-dGTP pyrophosphatase MutT (NUDIX family)
VLRVSGPEIVPTEQYVAGLHRRRMAAGVLIRDSRGRALLVEPSYRPDWSIPGGSVDADESHWAAAAREVTEELGITVRIGRLLVVDYVTPVGRMPEGVMFVFDGGIIDDTAFTFPDGEILSAEFCTAAEARERIRPVLAGRLEVALEALAQSSTALCENGRRIG